MRSGASASLTEGAGQGLQGFLWRQAGRLTGLALLAGAALGVCSLATWNVADPSFSHATGNPVTNAIGYPGAVFADLAMQFFGLASVAALVPAAIWGLIMATGHGLTRLSKRAFAWFAGAVLVAGAAGCFAPPPTWPLPTGLGGVFGDIALKLPSMFLGSYPTGLAGMIIALLLMGPALALFAYGASIVAREPAPVREEASTADEEDDDREDARGGILTIPLLLLGGMTHSWLTLRASIRRKMAGWQDRKSADLTLTKQDRGGWRRAAQQVDLAEMQEGRVSNDGRARVEPEFFAQVVKSETRREPVLMIDDVESVEEAADAIEYQDQAYDEPEAFGDEGMEIPPAYAPVQSFRTASAARTVRVESPAPPTAPAVRVRREAQAPQIKSDKFEMPSLQFLSEAKNVAKDVSVSKEALEQNARLLESVLEDFGVKGEIIAVRPGPVVTLYELEPAPGIKSSRVIGLSDDIARSMSAIACRVAVVPGRNAIGIELPNARRETVYLREILASKDFEQSKHKLALALGKSINGDVVTVDIAKMPHVLVAGTTGSGKSVAINTMILSLVYRMTPEQCRLIMVDPKMVELSVYDGIPHLLTPVVTEAKKAVVALKWTVREMEYRYRKMAKLGVRNQEGYNARIAEAAAKGETISRTVQTGFDRQTGEAIYESEELNLEPMPFIVVIIDEVADLMMVAGKDIEGAVQRLGQMARAAGIHVIMATQRPSVDVITGTIKANFPTRMSFQVTSKIDSRTILGEMGAEQLLGQGDMLYMAGGGRIQRVHGPFVSDDEVEKVVKHLKAQGVPQYLDAITQDDEEEAEEDAPRGGGSGSGNFDDSDDPYDQAVSIVLRDGKASTSYIQRRLGVGYNKAASIIERMEKEGIVGPANHAGKREILVPTEQDKM
jgi:S-DNA-T family DNA segregation ATPase FtsK/SpoIIIE